MKLHRSLTFAALALFVVPVALADWTTTTPGQVTTLDKVGVGTHTPEAGAGLAGTQEAPIHIVSSQNKNTFLLLQNATNDTNVAPAFRTMADTASQSFQSHASARTIARFGQTLGGWNEFLSVGGNGLILGTLAAKPLILGTSSAQRIHITSAGAVGIGMTPSASYALDVNGAAHMSGNLTVDGNLAAKYQDLAEWVPAIGDLSPAMVVIIAPESNNNVQASNEAYDTRVAGVISAQPGILLGEAGPDKVLVATTGRVKVRVDASNGAIRAGDLLATSGEPGVAMKSQPVDVNGIKLHRPGTLIGKALEPLEKGQGEILVLLSLQ